MRWMLAGLLMLGLSSASIADDWRKDAKDAEKIDKLVKVMPSTAVIMQQVGERYRDLYWAGKLGKWEFAEYQMEEIISLVKILTITRPSRAKTAEQFLDDGFMGMEAALEAKDWTSFSNAFEHMRMHCFACHKQNDHAFITLPKVPKRGGSIALED